MIQLSLSMASSNTNSLFNSSANNSTLQLNSSDDSDYTISLCNTQHLSLNEVSQFIGTNLNVFDFLHINCRSLPKNFDEINNTLMYIKKQLTVIAVTETWLKPVNNDLFQIPGYSLVSCSRPTKPGGGVGLFINDQYQYKPLSDLTFINNVIECIFIEVVLHNRCNLIIGCIYRPPNSDICDFNCQISSILKNNCLTKNKNIFC
jgi:hypothetical protein